MGGHFTNVFLPSSSPNPSCWFASNGLSTNRFTLKWAEIIRFRVLSATISDIPTSFRTHDWLQPFAT